MRVILACAIAALLAAPQVVLAAKDGPDDAAATPQGGLLQRASNSLKDYNFGNAPGIYRACESVGLCKSVEKDDTEPPKPKRQCLGTEGADGKCQLSAEAVCAAYPLSDEAEAAATTPAIGLNSIVAVFKGRVHGGVYFKVVEKEYKHRKPANRNKWKLRDSNGDERNDVLLPPANLRATSDEEKKAFDDAVTEANAAKAQGDTPPPRLSGAPAIMPGSNVVEEAQPSDAEIKVVKDPMHKAMCASGFTGIGAGGKRDANRKLLKMDLRQTVCLVDGAKCEIARREGKECKRSYGALDVMKMSPRKQLSDPEL
jgi:hypothetical protein